MDTGVNSAVAPLFDFVCVTECVWHERACVRERHALHLLLEQRRRAELSTAPPTTQPRCDVCFGGKKAATPLGFPCVIKAGLY